MIAAVIISFAVIVSLARAFLPFIDLLHSDIEQLVSKKVGAKVQFDAISAAWKSQGPELLLMGIRVTSNDQSQVPLTIEQLKVAVNFWQSLFQLRLVTDEVRLLDSRVEIDLNSSRVSLMGLTREQSVYSGSDVFIDTLLGQNDFVVKDIQVVFYRDNKAFPELRLNELLIQNYDDIHQLSGELYQEGGGTMQLVLELYGDPRLPGSKSNFYLNSHAINVAELPLVDTLLAGRIRQGKLNGEVWVDWNYQGWQQAHIDIELSPIQFTIEQQTFNYPSIRAVTHWQNIAPQLSEIRLTEFKAIAEDNSVVDLSGLTLNIDRRSQPKMQLTYQDIKPGQLNSVWALLMDEPKLQQWFLAANPQFDVNQLQLQAMWLDDEWQLTEGTIELSQVRLSRTEFSPETPPMSGKVQFSGDDVWFQLTSQPGELDYRPLFRYPIPLQQLQVQGHLVSFAAGSRLQFDKVHLVTDHLQLAAQGNVFFHANSDPELSLQVEIKSADVSAKSFYLPAHVMSDKLVQYLDSTVHQGSLQFAQLNMQVRLVDDLLAQPDASFQILAQINDLDYQYQPDFPKLDKLDALLYFDRDSMRIEAKNGQYKGLKVTSAIASIADFSANTPWLDLDIKANTDLRSAQQLVDNSRLKSLLGNVLQTVKPEGRFNAETKIRVPLSGDAKVAVNGHVSFDGNTVVIPNIKLELNKVKAQLTFDSSGVQAKQLTAEVLGGTLTGDIATEDFDGSERLVIQAQGEVDTAKALDWVLPDSQLPITGNSDLKLNAWFCIKDCRGNRTVVEVRSQLLGTQVDLPEPFNKDKQQEWPVEVHLSQTEQSQQLQFRVDSKLVAGLNYTRGKEGFELADGSLLIGQSSSAIERIEDAVALNLQLQQVDLLPWLSKTKDLLRSLTLNSPAQDSPPKASTVPLVAQFSIDTLLISGVPLHQVSAQMSRQQDESMLIRFTASEGQGEVTLRDNNVIELHLQTLELPEHLLQQWAEQKNSPEIVDFVDWPHLNIQCDECRLFGIDLNRLQMRLTPFEKQLQIEGNINRGALLSATYAFEWDLDANYSRVGATFQTNRLGNLLRDWGFKVGIKDSGASGQLGLYWSGAPYDFNLAELNGGVSVRLTEGYIEEVSDAKARIFSLFSLQSLLRRLTLDFKDLYQKGFFYDVMAGSFAIRNGIVLTDEFKIKGNVADVTIGGMVDLQRELFDQHVMVTPELTSSLPVLAGWAVEPTTGVVVWLLSKLFEPAIDVISNIEYRVVGDWNAPEVIELGKATQEVKLTEEQLEAIRRVHQKQEEPSDGGQPQAQMEPLDSQDDTQKESHARDIPLTKSPLNTTHKRQSEGQIEGASQKTQVKTNRDQTVLQGDRYE
jgi:uncharacterized protein (TIGR02099 family)